MGKVFRSFDRPIMGAREAVFITFPLCFIGNQSAASNATAVEIEDKFRHF